MKKSILFVILLFLISSNFYAQHFVLLKNGKKIECIVTELKNDTLEIYVEMMAQKLHIKHVETIHFQQHVEYDGKLTEKSEAKSFNTKGGIIEYEVEGRKIIKAPAITNATEKKGRVVVKVIIDKYGHVMNAETGYIGTNTSDKYLLVKALKVAKEVSFDAKPKGPLKTEALIIIEYK